MHENGQWLVYSLYVFKGIIKMVYCRSVHLFTKKKKSFDKFWKYFYNDFFHFSLFSGFITTFSSKNKTNCVFVCFCWL